MSYRFTNTEKWSDSWFSQLSQIEMLLFIYLCDNCDIAGFIEVNYKRWANDLNSTIGTIEGACKGLARGLIFSKNNDCIFIRNFLRHQKNLPLNENNKAHVGILKRFDIYRHKFDIEDINEFILSPLQGGSKGLQSPTGIGIGNGIGNGKEEEPKILKIEYGENVKLTADEYSKLYSEFGEVETDKAIKYLADYKIEKGYKTKSDYLTLRRWVFDAIKKQNGNTTTKSKTELFAESTNWAREADRINAMVELDHENCDAAGNG